MRERIWGWYFFDWASQPYHTLLVTFIFGPFFVSVANDLFLSRGLSEDVAKADAQALWSLGLTITGLAIGLSAPFLGALADTSGRKTPWIAVFSIFSIAGASGLWWVQPDGSNLWWALLSFGLGFAGAEFASIFTNAQLPSLGPRNETGRLSGSGFAFGYLGGLIALIIALVFLVEQPNGNTVAGLSPAFGLDADMREGTRSIGPFVALWFAVFMVPYFLWVRETEPRKIKATVTQAMARLGNTVRGLRHRKSLTSFLVGSMLYRDALNGLYSFGGTYATLVLAWTITEVGIFGIVGVISAATLSYFGGRLDRQLGPKPVILMSIVLLVLVSIIILSMGPSAIFGVELPPDSNLPTIVMYVCGALIGGLGGILQGASRSLMVRHARPDAPTESFGLYGLAGRATSFLAPMLIAAVTATTESVRLGITPLIVLFLLGLVLLFWVKPDGDRAVL